MEPPATPPSLPRRKRWWRILRKLTVAFGLLLLAGVFWLFVCPDEPPPDVRDIVIAPLTLPDDQNAYVLANKAAALAQEKLSGADGDRLKEMAQGENWDSALAKQWLDGTDAIWPLWEQVARTPRGQMPPPKGLGDIFPLLPFRRIESLAQIRARDLGLRGHPDEAVKAVLTILQANRRIEGSRVVLIQYIDAATQTNTALATLRDVAVKSGPSAATLRQILAQLGESRPSKDSFGYAVRSELVLLDDSMRILMSGVTSDGEKVSIWQRLAVKIPRLFQPNKTRRIYVDNIREALKAIDLPGDLLENLRRAALPVVTLGGGYQGAGAFWPDNIIGRRLLGIVNPGWVTLLKTVRLREQSRLSATELFLALLLYHREHGELPATLDALVPTYLPAVPRDYFDGQPIRYSRELRAVWSVGLHHFTVSQPGLKLDDADARVEIYLPLDFAAPPAETKPAPAAAAP